MQTIYADVLIALNIYINFILILATARITGSKASHAIISAVYGSFYSLMILLPEINIFLNMLIKIFAGVTIVIIAFGFAGIKRMLVNTICFFTVNFIFGGVIFAVYIWLKPSFMHFNNTYFYVDFSLLTLIFVTTFLYTMLCIFRYIADRRDLFSDEYRISVKYHGKSVVLKGLADTGNSLVDFFTGKPVIICSRDEISEILSLPESPEEYLKIKGIRIIPYSVISGDGIIPVFTPDEVMIFNENKSFRKKADVLIGICSSGNRAIFNPRLLKL